jgi:uncharacterized DUF497 family protein
VIFAWNDWNIRHIAEHGVTQNEAEHVVLRARQPYPVALDSVKWLVVGKTASGRVLHVIFVMKGIAEVEPSSVRVFDLADASDVVEVIFVIHAMPASIKMKRHDRRRRKK